jgi:hypothetical protein
MSARFRRRGAAAANAEEMRRAAKSRFRKGRSGSTGGPGQEGGAIISRLLLGQLRKWRTSDQIDEVDFSCLELAAQ